MNINLRTEKSNCYLCNNEISHTLKVKDWDIKICPNCLTKLIVEMAEGTSYDYVVFDAFEKLRNSNVISEIYKQGFEDIENIKHKLDQAEQEVEFLGYDIDSRDSIIENLEEELSELKIQIRNLVS